MPVQRFEDLCVADLSHVFDAGSLARGMAYARENRIDNVVFNEAHSMLSGEVQGNRAQPYQTLVAWSADANSGTLDLRTVCTCPVGSECKHAVALILEVLNDRTISGEPALRNSSSWRRPLQPLLDAASSQEATDAAPLALQFTLTQPRPPANYRRTEIPIQLKVRPLVRGARGTWVKTRASWQDISNRYNHFGQIEEHREALRALLAECPQSGYGYYNQPALDLADFGSGLWAVLERAAEVGVEFVGARVADGPITLDSRPASVSLDVTRDPANGDLLLEPTVIIDSETPICLATGDVQLLGIPAHGFFTCVPLDAARGPHITLLRLDRPPGPELRTFVSTHQKVVIPAADVDEFIRDFYPRLARSASLVSHDDSVKLPEIAPPQVALTVAYADDGAASLAWGFTYRQDSVIHRVDLHSSADETLLRDVVAERVLLRDLDVPDDELPALRTLVGSVPTLVPRIEFRGYDVVILTEDVLPKLRSNGQVDIDISGQPPVFNFNESAPTVAVSVADTAASNDWFDLNVAITIDGEEIGFEELFVALAADQTHLVLASGTYLRIDRPEFEQLGRLIAEARSLQDTTGDGLQINRYHADLWDEFSRLGIVEHQSQRWASTVQGLLNIDRIAAPPLPAGLHAELRPYQRDGYAWLSFLYDHGLGGILADDMGLGKTVQALALMCRVCEQAVENSPRPRFLVVAPTSVVENWARESARFAPGLRVATIRETQSRRGTTLRAEIGEADLVVTSYALFRIEFDAYADLEWSGLILDEAQFVKNHQGKTYQCARKLDAPFKLAITGTPLENSLMDLWALLSITAPGLYPNPRRFATIYQKPIERGTAPHMLANLRRRIRPLMRRRTKEEVATDLPPKQEQVVEVALTPRHAKIYQTHLQRERQKVLGLLKDVDKNRFAIFRSLTLLRQLSLDPALVDDKYEKVGSSKADVLIEQLTEIAAEGHRALVFSQFTGYLKRIRTRLDAEGIAYSYLDGRTTKRQAAIDGFRDGDAPVFLISLKAGGFGLNLTEADYCFVLDPWWNPASEAQAVDRAHRIGQTKTVMVYRYVAANTIEEKVMELKARKQKLFASVMDGDGALSSALNAEDIRGLLG